jgi:hypothetical protein
MITITFTEQSMGLQLSGVDERGQETLSPDAPCAYVVVSGMRPGSTAAASGELQVGHAIHAVQGTPWVKGQSFNETAEVLRAAGRPIQITFVDMPVRSGGDAAAAASHEALSAEQAEMAELKAMLQAQKEENRRLALRVSGLPLVTPAPEPELAPAPPATAVTESQDPIAAAAAAKAERAAREVAAAQAAQAAAVAEAEAAARAVAEAEVNNTPLPPHPPPNLAG